MALFISHRTQGTQGYLDLPLTIKAPSSFLATCRVEVLTNAEAIAPFVGAVGRMKSLRWSASARRVVALCEDRSAVRKTLKRKTLAEKLGNQWMDGMIVSRGQQIYKPTI